MRQPPPHCQIANLPIYQFANSPKSAHKSPVSPQTIPAKAGISQCCIGTIAKIIHTLPFPHNHMPPTAAYLRGMADSCRHDTVRFLLPQEWSGGGNAAALSIRQFTNLPNRQIAKSPTNLPSPRRPFLRRQESHSVI